MSRHMSSVLEIKPEPKKSWTVLVQLLENGHVQQSRLGNDFKRLVFTDTQGTKVTALIYSHHLRYFANIFAQYKRYYISNAVLTKTDPRYRISEYLYSWVLNNRTLVEELVESIPATFPCEFEFTSFHDLHKYADSDCLQSVRAIVLQCFPSQEQGSELTTRRDVVIVNEEKKLLLLTLWNQFDDKEGNILSKMLESGPIIFGMRLKVTTFNCLSLTTRASSALMINPPASHCLQMQEWYNNNMDELQQLLQMKTYKNSDTLLPYPKDEDIVSVATAVASLNRLKTAWIKGNTSLPRQERSCWYTACGNCQKSLEADITWIVRCTSCRAETEVVAMSRLTILIDDGTAAVQATISSPVVQKFIPFNAEDFKQAEEEGSDLHDAIAMSFHQQTIVAFIRSYEVVFNGQTEVKISVVNAYKQAEALTPPNLNYLPTTAGEQASQSAINLIADPPTTKGKEQLFSPSTKMVLEEISSAMPSKIVKRSLAFSTETRQNETTSIAKPQASLLAVKKEIGAKLTDGNPTKKTKESAT